MGTTDEVVIVQRKYRVSRVQELGMENDLDAVRGVVKQLAASQLIENGILRVIYLRQS